MKTLILTALTFTAMAASGEYGYIKADSVLSVVTADWNEDGWPDRAILAEHAESGDADLYIYLSHFDPATGQSERRLIVDRSSFVWAGDMWGTQPQLSLTPQGSLVIESGNEAIGRTRWNQKLTVAYRSGVMMVAGYTYTDRDTLDLTSFSCDVNLLTGKGIRDGKAFTSSASAQPLSEWEYSSIPEECLR